jgi:hypothetical protein
MAWAVRDAFAFSSCGTACWSRPFWRRVVCGAIFCCGRQIWRERSNVSPNVGVVCGNHYNYDNVGSQKITLV